MAVIRRHVQPGPCCRVSVTSVEALSIHVGQVIAAVAELGAALEQGTIPTVTERKRRR